MVDDGARLDPVSTAFHEMEKDRDAHTIMCVVRIDGVVPEEEIRRRVKVAVARFPTFSSVVVEQEGVFSLRKIWTPVDLDLDRHLFVEERGRFKERELQSRLDEIFALPLAKDVPRWAFHYIYFPLSKVAFLVPKVSHTYGDGPMLSHIFSSISDPGKEVVSLLPVRRYSLLYKLYTTILLLWLIVTSAFRRSSVPELRINTEAAATKPVRQRMLCSWPRDQLRTTAAAHGATVHVLLQALLFRAVRLYDGHRRALRSISVFSLRKKPKLTCLDATNNMGVMYTAVGADAVRAADILGSVQRFTDCYKAAFVFPLFWAAVMKLAACTEAQPMVRATSWCADAADFGLSSYKVPLSGLKVGGHKVSQVFAVVKPYRFGTAFSATSYGETVTLAASFRDGNLDDIDKFRECLRLAYKELEQSQ